MFEWHKMLMSGERRIEVVGGYRTHADPMQVVSSSLHDREVYFEAPPSSKMTGEMDIFVVWFNETGPNGKRALPALTRASIAHLHFVSIHPFEDGNGRIARACGKIACTESRPSESNPNGDGDFSRATARLINDPPARSGWAELAVVRRLTDTELEARLFASAGAGTGYLAGSSLDGDAPELRRKQGTLSILREEYVAGEPGDFFLMSQFW
jgi:Fic/DOC family